MYPFYNVIGICTVVLPLNVYIFRGQAQRKSSVHVSRADVEAQLERSRKIVPINLRRVNGKILICKKQQLAEVPPEIPLIYRWRKAPHPRIMAYNKGQKAMQGRIVPANYPFCGDKFAARNA